MVRLLLVAVVCASLSSSAQADVYSPPRDQRCLAASRQQLAHAETIVRAEITMLERRLAAYEPMTRFNNAGPLLVTYEETRLALLQRQLYLEHLRQAQRALGRSRAW